MGTIKKLICNNCGKEYNTKYRRSDILVSGERTESYQCTTVTRFCSKSCKTHFQMGTLDKEKILKEIETFIFSKGRYCLVHEITNGISRSNKTFAKYGINTVLVNSNLGFKNKGPSNFQNKIYLILKTKYDNIISEYTN